MRYDSKQQQRTCLMIDEVMTTTISMPNNTSNSSMEISKKFQDFLRVYQHFDQFLRVFVSVDW